MISEIAKEENSMHQFYSKAKALDLIDGACKACSNKIGVLEEIKLEGLMLLDDMSRYPCMTYYMEQGYEIITF